MMAVKASSPILPFPRLWWRSTRLALEAPAEVGALAGDVLDHRDDIAGLMGSEVFHLASP